VTPDPTGSSVAGNGTPATTSRFWAIDPSGTASRGSRIIGTVALVGLAVLALFALVLSPSDAGPNASVNEFGEMVRILYVHVPVAIVCFLAFAVTAFASAMVLWRKTEFWDLLAAASAEVGVVFTALTLITGSLWGHVAWGTWWECDARLTSTALLLVLFVGYLALRRAITDPQVRARRAAIAGLISFADVPIVHYSVDWWRSLHQPATITRFNPTIDGIELFTLMLGMVVFLIAYIWLMIHRFRLQYVQARIDDRGLDVALVERRAEASTVLAASGGTRQ